jgi:hypothetical protein
MQITMKPLSCWGGIRILTVQLVPSRESFFEKLGVQDEATMDEMAAFLVVFSPILADIQNFLKEKGLDDPTPV